MATMEKKQQAVLRCLNTLISARGYSPTVADSCAVYRQESECDDVSAQPFG